MVLKKILTFGVIIGIVGNSLGLTFNVVSPFFIKNF